MRALAIALLALASCGKGGATASKEVTGTLTVAGKARTVTKCRPDHGLSTYVVLETSDGALRFEDKKLYWNADDPEGFLSGKQLDCTRMDRSWGGGVRKDGSAYWRGTLSFDCKLGADVVTGELTLDCGNITAEERAQLDGKRKELIDDQLLNEKPKPPTP